MVRRGGFPFGRPLALSCRCRSSSIGFRLFRLPSQSGNQARVCLEAISVGQTQTGGGQVRHGIKATVERRRYARITRNGEVRPCGTQLLRPLATNQRSWGIENWLVRASRRHKLTGTADEGRQRSSAVVSKKTSGKYRLMAGHSRFKEMKRIPEKQRGEANI
jgi:hypothetical protein